VPAAGADTGSIVQPSKEKAMVDLLVSLAQFGTFCFLVWGAILCWANWPRRKKVAERAPEPLSRASKSGTQCVTLSARDASSSAPLAEPARRN
jgi:hypothetical protein